MVFVLKLKQTPQRSAQFINVALNDAHAYHTYARVTKTHHSGIRKILGTCLLASSLYYF